MGPQNTGLTKKCPLAFASESVEKTVLRSNVFEQKGSIKRFYIFTWEQFHKSTSAQRKCAYTQHFAQKDAVHFHQQNQAQLY